MLTIYIASYSGDMLGMVGMQVLFFYPFAYSTLFYGIGWGLQSGDGHDGVHPKKEVQCGPLGG